MKNNKLLIITHETSRTGAPMVLLYFLQWLQANKPEIHIDVLALNGGNLEEKFKNSCQNYYPYTSLIKPKKLSFLQKVFLKLGLIKNLDKKEKLLKELCKNNYNLVYANTIIAIPYASQLVSENKNSKLIAHIHELNAIIKLALPNFKNHITLINQFIVPSILVKTNLVNNWSVLENIIDVVHECTTVNNIDEKIPNVKKPQIFTVGASGTVHWRKGHDMFLQIARYISNKYPDCEINFVWVGKLPLREQIILEADLQKLEITEVVSFVGEVENPSRYFNDFDVFVMTSREDPFPLVCIEVGILGKPIISFDKAVGTNEILEQGGGFIVPYLNIEAMAEKVMMYYNNRDLIKQHGAFNQKVFSKFTPEQICPQLFSVIQKVINT